jgi:hypothetical protein
MDKYKKKLSLAKKMVSACLLLFAISLPFHEIEWNVFNVRRFELKPTMVTFALLVLAWFYYFLRNRLSLIKQDVVFAIIALLYAFSQFLSLLNSPFPLDSIKQGIIIACLMAMMIVVSQAVLNKRIIKQIFLAWGFISLTIVGISLANYAFFTDHSARLGQVNSLGFFHLGGDTFYFGDLLLLCLGGVLYLILTLLKKPYGTVLSLILAGIWLSAVALTFTKGLIISVFFFFLVLALFARRKRAMIFWAIGAIALALSFNYAVVRHRILQPNLVINQSGDARVSSADIAQSQLLARMNVLSIYGSNSLGVRWKSVKISLKDSANHFWLGNGAGLSQKLIGGMANEYDRGLSAQEAQALKQRSLYGEAVNANLIDGHNLFITEFFNVGFVGVGVLILLTVFVVVRLIKAVRLLDASKDILPHLLLATTSALLLFRMAGSLIVLPSLWFMFGLGMGAARIYSQKQDTEEI